jgi:hypothetical protein
MKIFDLRLCRLCFNEHAWERPGPLEKGEKKSFAAKNQFGHEEWLNRADWTIKGLRYSFLQSFHPKNIPGGESFEEVLFYTFVLTKSGRDRRIVGLVRDVSKLSVLDAADAVRQFRKKGWLGKMQSDLKRLGIPRDFNRSDPLDVLNVCFRPKNLIWFKNALANCHRYDLYRLH